MSLENRMAKIEAKLDKHLDEAGEVRESIKELKKGLDLISARMWGAVVGSVLTLTATVGFLLKVTLWGK